MPDIKNFDNQQIIEPGVYSNVLGKTTNPAITGSYGNVMLIDTGVGAGYGGGSGVNGQLKQGGDTVYSFTTPDDFKKFVRGGILWLLADYLFAPATNGIGAQKLFYARAATTTAPQVTINFGVNLGSCVISCKQEGASGNGVTNTNGFVTGGYGIKVKSGVLNQSAFVIEFYEGRYRGVDENGIEYDNLSQQNIKNNTLICRSAEFTTMAQFIAWTITDVYFNAYFVVTSHTNATQNTALSSTFLASFPNIVLFSGGSIEYNSTDLDDLLESIPDLDNSMFICSDYGIVANLPDDTTDGFNKGAMSAENLKILTYCLNTATDKLKMLYIGGGADSTQFTNGTNGSLEVAAYYNNQLVTVVHSDVRVPAISGTSGLGYRYLNTLFSAGLACGKAAGVEPQVNLTYKSVRITGLKHDLKKSEREKALLGGVLHFRNVSGIGWVINQGINTLQLNDSVIYNDGTSPEISIVRIAHQINKELRASLSIYVGGNIGSANATEIKSFMESYLQSRSYNTFNENLIITFQQVTVTLVNAAWQITYCFVPNGPINQIFTTGFMLDPRTANLNA